MYLLYLYIILVTLSLFYYKKQVPVPPPLFTQTLPLLIMCLFCEDDYIITVEKIPNILFSDYGENHFQQHKLCEVREFPNQMCKNI